MTTNLETESSKQMANTLLDKAVGRISKIIESYTDQKNTNLYLSYYHDKHEERRKEIQNAILLNERNKLFKKIYIICEGLEPIDFIKESDTVVISYEEKRFTFNDFFRFSNEKTQGDTTTTNILINSDIVIGENFDNILLEDKQALCITRYDVIDYDDYDVYENEFLAKGSSGSFDTFVWKGQIPDTICDFYMGKWFCDGRAAHELQRSDYLLKNPARDLKTYHIHFSNVRNYNYCSRDDRIPGCRTGLKLTNNDNIFDKGDMYDDGYYPY